jgi:hypothetical protein
LFGGLIGVSLFDAILRTGGVIFRIPFNPGFELFSLYPGIRAIEAWVHFDARQMHSTPCFDFGLFVPGTWQLSVPAYLFWTRGWIGLLVMLLMWCLFAFPGVSATIVLDLTRGWQMIPDGGSD